MRFKSHGEHLVAHGIENMDLDLVVELLSSQLQDRGRTRLEGNEVVVINACIASHWLRLVIPVRDNKCMPSTWDEGSLQGDPECLRSLVDNQFYRIREASRIPLP